MRMILVTQLLCAWAQGGRLHMSDSIIRLGWKSHKRSERVFSVCTHSLSWVLYVSHPWRPAWEPPPLQGNIPGHRDKRGGSRGHWKLHNYKGCIGIKKRIRSFTYFIFARSTGLAPKKQNDLHWKYVIRTVQRSSIVEGITLNLK